jgi:hypothetical protein
LKIFIGEMVSKFTVTSTRSDADAPAMSIGDYALPSAQAA